MKTLIFTLIMSLSLAATAADSVANQKAEKRKTQKQTTLANPYDFIGISDVRTSEINVFLSYTGRHFDHCGIVLKGHSFGARSEEIFKTLSVSRDDQSGEDISEPEELRVIARINDPNEMRYGANFTIKTRSGRSLSEEIAKLDSYNQAEVVVEILSCK